MEKGKWLNARDALRRAIHPRCRIFFSMAAAQPQTLLHALAEDHEFYREVEVINIYLLTDHPLAKPGMEASFRCLSLQNSPFVRQDWEAGRIDYIPLHYTGIPSVFSSGGPAPIDVALIQVSPPDRHGRVSLGASTCLTYPLAKGAKRIIAEVNQQAPRTHGPCSFSAEEIDFLVEASHPLIPYPEIKISEAEKKITAITADLIPDGSTLEIGIGNVPPATLQLLEGKKDLGIHSGMLSDGIVDLVANGTITNRRKTLYSGKLVAGELMGSQKLFRFAHENEAVEMHTVEVIHNPRSIAQIKKFVALNTAIEIDLSGQMNAESLGGSQISGVGGLFDFVQGAFFSGGKSITVLTATAGRGKVSRIVSALGKGTPVTIPRHLADTVVTEFGIAELRGKTLLQRAEALIAIAHPDFRDQLREEFRNGRKA